MAGDVEMLEHDGPGPAHGAAAAAPGAFAYELDDGAPVVLPGTERAEAAAGPSGERQPFRDVTSQHSAFYREALAAASEMKSPEGRRMGMGMRSPLDRSAAKRLWSTELPPLPRPPGGAGNAARVFAALEAAGPQRPAGEASGASAADSPTRHARRGLLPGPLDAAPAPLAVQPGVGLLGAGLPLYPGAAWGSLPGSRTGSNTSSSDTTSSRDQVGAAGLGRQGSQASQQQAPALRPRLPFPMPQELAAAQQQQLGGGGSSVTGGQAGVLGAEWGGGADGDDRENDAAGGVGLAGAAEAVPPSPFPHAENQPQRRR